MIFLWIFGPIVAYFLIGAFYARAKSVYCYQKCYNHNKRWYSCRDEFTKRDYPYYLVRRFLLWPLYLFIDIPWGWLGRWFTKPLETRRQEHARLLEDADKWMAVIKDRNVTESEREMARELRTFCLERAEERKI